MGEPQREHFRQIRCECETASSWRRSTGPFITCRTRRRTSRSERPGDIRSRNSASSCGARDRERKLIKKIDEALASVSSGDYRLLRVLRRGRIGIRRLGSPARPPRCASTARRWTRFAKSRPAARTAASIRSSCGVRAVAGALGLIAKHVPTVRWTIRASSPTGALHFGSLDRRARSCLQARSNGGQWLVRMEDLDPPREVPGAASAILRDLERLGFEWDGPSSTQSERTGALSGVRWQARRREAVVYECSLLAQGHDWQQQPATTPPCTPVPVVTGVRDARQADVATGTHAA